MFEEMWQDLRLAWRGLRRAKAFTAAAVLSLATGIAGISLTFALVNGVLLRPLPVRDQDRLLVAWTELRSTGANHWPFRVGEIEVVRDSSRLLEDVAGVSYNGTGRLVALENDAASYMDVAPVMGDFFAVLGINPVAGRALSRADDLTGAENVLVITHGLTRVVRDLLFKVAPIDPVAIVTAMLLLVAVSAIASYLPVRRAARVDPVALLKTV